MENVDPASLLNKVKEGQHREGIHTGFLSLEHLPREVLIRVVSKLANDVSALKNLCVTSRSLADVFRSAIAVEELSRDSAVIVRTVNCSGTSSCGAF